MPAARPQWTVKILGARTFRRYVCVLGVARASRADPEARTGLLLCSFGNLVVVLPVQTRARSFR